MNQYPRRQWIQHVTSTLLATAAATLPGCVPAVAGDVPDLVWGRRGLSQGRFLKPRAIAIDPQDELFIVDTTGRIQVFDVDGNFLRQWEMPETSNGRPTGLTIDFSPHPSAPNNDGRILVADTHYHRMTIFDLTGKILPEQRIGGTAGFGPGEFAFVTDATCDSKGNYYIGEYGDSDRIQKFASDGTFLTQWGGTGQEPGRFVRPQSLVMSPDDVLWIVDACNHRVQVYDCKQEQPAHLTTWGSRGHGLGELYFPYDLALCHDGSVVVCEYGNQRLQRFTPEGEFIAHWGAPGHSPGQLYQPWGVVIDSKDRIHVLDSNNHRVQRLTI
ncbi:NHL repeat protein [Roseimaritima multifibrata]|uniref:NHL repeat protein n=1 Tax=Roseimaritima multifibrata TaxID=1930274 RepID=A0A517MJ95_9BACT|nr:NHL repeat-containing protein [Roseimaritima multifibrata]QDS94943.1 NHL repeat protein [Roseimaritima multifibrata]